MSEDIRKSRATNLDRMIQCFVCTQNEPLPTAEDHHRVPRAFGGTDDQANRVWLCPSCHARLHRIQGLLLQGQAASAYALTASIFPTNGKAREQLWVLANEAATAERTAKEVFGLHQTQQKVTLTVEADVWSVIKSEAKARKISASRFAAEILKRSVREKM